MRAGSMGVLVAALALTLGGCGKTDDVSSSSTGGGSQGGSSTGGSAQGGANAMGGGQGSPDGPIPPAQALHKLDLLLMVDNSMHMVNKARLLSDAMRSLLETPDGPKLAADDIHIGVITSSLGSHGAMDPKDVCVSPEDDDHAHLLGQLRPGLKSFQNTGFLAWGGDAPKDGVIASDLEAMLLSAGELGCGYESSLEAWYRFLIDPAPPQSVVLTGTTAARQGVDQTILTQRQAFLRPDSVLAIVTLSDENDCSIVDDGLGWLVHRATPMYRATSACSTNPNDPCCQSCGAPTPAAGCPSPASDPACATPLFAPGMGDDLNLRCWDQKRRFGVDLLYPLSRYVDGLTRQMVPGAAGTPVQNPLFATHARHPSQVIYTSIVGVPWQDIADPASLTGPGLTFMTAAELTANNRWQAIVGDPSAVPPVAPADPFMIETPTDRAELSSVNKNPFVNEPIVASGSTNPQANHINGHEQVNSGRELQAACIFPLEQPRTCDYAAQDAGTACRCFPEDTVYNAAVCQPPGGGAPSTSQYYDLAYPGVRHLELSRRLGNNAVVGSICPKIVENTAQPDYGYRPTIRALAARIDQALKP